MYNPRGLPRGSALTNKDVLCQEAAVGMVALQTSNRHAINCESQAQLTSPPGQRVVGTLKVGEVLDVQVVNMKGQLVVQVVKGGQAAERARGTRCTPPS